MPFGLVCYKNKINNIISLNQKIIDFMNIVIFFNVQVCWRKILDQPQGTNIITTKVKSIKF